MSASCETSDFYDEIIEGSSELQQTTIAEEAYREVA